MSTSKVLKHVLDEKTWDLKEAALTFSVRSDKAARVSSCPIDTNSASLGNPVGLDAAVAPAERRRTEPY